MSTLYKRIYYLIALYLPTNTLFSFFSSSKLLYSISTDSYFWKQRLLSDYNCYFFTNDKYKQNYITMYTSKTVYGMGNNLYSQLGSENPINIKDPIPLNKGKKVISGQNISFILCPDKNLYAMGNLYDFFKCSTLPEKTNGMYKIYSNVENIFIDNCLYFLLSDDKLYYLYYNDEFKIRYMGIDGPTDIHFPYYLKDEKIYQIKQDGDIVMFKNVKQFNVLASKIFCVTFNNDMYSFDKHGNTRFIDGNVTSLDSFYANGRYFLVYQTDDGNLYELSRIKDYIDSNVAQFFSDGQGTIIIIYKNKKSRIIRNDTGPAKHLLFLL